ncbi:MAG: transporter substrate-binding domain-containing protein [Gammaproteobacteria bacterium]|nr:transporter substrate-binding domain-containing protein [Gammaproteobacteria bacterium]
MRNRKGIYKYNRLSLFVYAGLILSILFHSCLLHSAPEIASGLSLTLEEKTFIEEHPVLRVHNEQNWAPFNFNYDGEPSGYSIDYMKLLANKIGIQIKFVSGPTWDEFLQMIKRDELDIMLNIVDTQERREYLTFTNPYVISSAGIYTTAGPSEIKSLDDLKGKSIAIPKGFYYADLLRRHYPEIEIIEDVRNSQEALEAVSFGRADATLGEVSVLDYQRKKFFISNISLVGKVDDVRFTAIMNLAVNKENPLLRSILQKGMDTISEQELIPIKERWGAFTNRPIKRPEQALFNNIEIQRIKSKGHITMCVDPDWLPFEALDEKNRHIGMSAEFISLLIESSNLPIKLVPTKTWSQTLAYAEDRTCDIISLAADTPPRRQYLNFTSPYLHFSLVIATRSEELFVENIEQVMKRPLAVVKGYAMSDILRERYPGIELVEVKNVKDGLERVHAGEIYGFIDAIPSIGYAIQNMGYTDIKISGKLGIDWTLSIAVRNDDPLLLGIMEKAIKTVPKKSLQAIKNRWLTVRFEQGIDYTLIWWLLLIFSLIVLFFTYYNLQLSQFNRKIRVANDEISHSNHLLTEKTQELERLSYTDRLTQLYNRMKLDEVFQQELERAERYKSQFTIIILDLDHFKTVNDTHGHPYGDYMLKCVAQTLKSYVRATDTLGRWGGEEFMIISPETTLEGGSQLAETLRNKIEGLSFDKAGVQTASFGVAAYRQGEQENTLVSRADKALYRAKHQGRNRVALEETQELT